MIIQSIDKRHLVGTTITRGCTDKYNYCILINVILVFPKYSRFRAVDTDLMISFKDVLINFIIYKKETTITGYTQ